MNLERLDYLDNLKATLTILVILHHVAIAYGAFILGKTIRPLLK